jgi:anti-sigma B factor antagonist
LEIEEKEGVWIVRFVQSDLLHDETIDVIGEQIHDLIKRGGCRRLVLQFGTVRRISSHMLGELVVLLKRMLTASGCVVLCAFAPELRDTFTLLRLDRIFTIRDTEEEAVQFCRTF